MFSSAGEMIQSMNMLSMPTRGPELDSQNLPGKAIQRVFLGLGNGPGWSPGAHWQVRLNYLVSFEPLKDSG